MTPYRITELYDETAQPIDNGTDATAHPDEWTDVKRPPEVAAFQLILHDVHDGIAWTIIETRWSAAKQALTKERERLLRIYGHWLDLSTHNRGFDRRAYVQVTAKAYGITAAEVYDILSVVDGLGLMREAA